MTKPSEDWERRAQKAGQMLWDLAVEALQRGDVHEYRHLTAAITAGNSESCADGLNCHLDHPAPVPGLPTDKDEQ